MRACVHACVSVWASYMCVAVQHVRAHTLSHVFINFPEPPSWYGWTVAAALLHICLYVQHATHRERSCTVRPHMRRSDAADTDALPQSTHAQRSDSSSKAELETNKHN